MRGATGGLYLGDEVRQRRVGGKLAVLDGQVDHAQIHRHHAARANIGVPNLGIAHLARGQAHIAAMGDQRCVRVLAHQSIEIGRVRQGGRIGRGVIAEPPAIKDAQNDRFDFLHEGLRVLAFI